MFQIIFIVGLLSISAWSIPTESTYLQWLRNKVSVSGGTETSGPSYQAFVNVIKNDSPCTDPDVLWSCFGTDCPGTIISSTAVIVPAHCATDARNPIPGVSIIAGAHDIRDQDDNWQDSLGRNIYIHPEYNSTTGENDIAIVTAYSHIKFNDYVRKADLPDENIGPLVGKIATLTGWGISYDGDFYLVPEQEANTTIIDNVKCSESYDGINDSLLCTSGEGGVGACTGDEGSPLAIDGVVIGMVKHMPKVCGNGEPTVYTRISKYVTWIQEVLDSL